MEGGVAGWGLRKWIMRGLECAKKFVLDSATKEEPEGQESHDQICHLGSSLAGVLRG